MKKTLREKIEGLSTTVAISNEGNTTRPVRIEHIKDAILSLLRETLEGLRMSKAKTDSEEDALVGHVHGYNVAVDKNDSTIDALLRELE